MFLDHIIYDKYETVPVFKLHFRQNSPLVQIHTTVSGCKGIENISGSHFVKGFQLFRRILSDISNITKVLPIQ
jgi:hypothetical protein